MIRAAGVTVRKEIHSVDLVVYTANRVFCIDVSILNPLEATYIGRRICVVCDECLWWPGSRRCFLQMIDGWPHVTLAFVVDLSVDEAKIRGKSKSIPNL